MLRHLRLQRTEVLRVTLTENLLLRRNEVSANKVSNLLNVTDGFLADQLRLQVIATVNCPFEDLDPAIARPGRLVGYRHFPRIDRKQARLLASTRGLILQDQEDYSLAEAEVFFSESICAVASSRPRFEFSQ